MKGEFNAYAQTKILENQKAYLRDMEQSIVTYAMMQHVRGHRA